MAKESHYDYSPSVPTAVIAIIIFVVLFFVHSFFLIKRRTWFCVPFVLGALFEIIGYASRAVGNKNPGAMAPYIMQALLVLLAPILFAASVYMFLGRIIRATGYESLSMIRLNWLTKIFVGGDILCFLIQAMGGSMLASAKTKSQLNLGKGVILAGLVIQVVIFGFFVAVAAVFHVRAKKQPSGKGGVQPWHWERLNMLYGVSLLITLRNIFRIIEYAGGNNSYLQLHEWPIYVFDALPMALVLGITTLWHVGKIVPDAPARPNTDFEMGVSESEERLPLPPRPQRSSFHPHRNSRVYPQQQHQQQHQQHRHHQQQYNYGR